MESLIAASVGLLTLGAYFIVPAGLGMLAVWAFASGKD